MTGEIWIIDKYFVNNVPNVYKRINVMYLNTLHTISENLKHGPFKDKFKL